jgi:hypothetical protein
MEVERQVLARYFPGFKLTGERLTGKLRTSVGNVYSVRIELDGFPDAVPDVWIDDPSMVMHDGQLLAEIGASSTMHTLNPDDDDRVQICHHHPAKWTSSNTLYMVVMKALVWLEAWEGHRATGKSLDRFLREG